MARMNRRRISTTLLALLCVSTAHAVPNSAERVRTFAALPDWTGIWLSAAWPTEVSGRVPGGEAQRRAGMQLIRHPPYNAACEGKVQADIKNTAGLGVLSVRFKV